MAEFFIVTGIVVAAVLGPYLLVTWAAMGAKREKGKQKEST
jgi:hypothetical protein